MLVQVFLFGYAFYTGYKGRQDIVEMQRRGCERGKLDRNDNALGWRNAQKARIADGDFDVAKTYGKIAAGLEERSEIICTEAFPKARYIP